MKSINKLNNNIPPYKMRIKYKTPYKTKTLYAEWDGDDRIEVYKTKDSYNLSWMSILWKEDKIEYYLSKHAKEPKFKGCSLIMWDKSVLSQFTIVRV